MSEFPIDHPQREPDSPPSDDAPTSGSPHDTGATNVGNEPKDPVMEDSVSTDHISSNQEPRCGSDSSADLSGPITAKQYLRQGGIHTGKVTRVTTETVFIDLPGDVQGFVPLIEFAAQTIPTRGDEIPVMVEKVDSDSGLLLLSKRHADGYSFWESVKPGDMIEGVVTGMNKGGLDIDIGGARAFLPGPQVDVRPLRDISTLIGEHVRCIVTQVDRTIQDLIVSRRKYIEKELKEQRNKVIDSLVEGEMCSGIVSNITDFGAFIDLGGVDGLLHVTDMSWSRIKDPKDVLQAGQQVDVRILKVNKETGKISLGLKQTKPNPWENIETKYPQGSRARGKAIRLADFGVFLELEQDVEALLPISEMSWSRRISHPSELVSVGQEIEVVVLKIDPSKKRFSVGLKQLEGNPWAKVEEEFQTNSMVKGKVSKVMEYGAFIELLPGVEGLIHISELSHKRVKSVADELKEGQEVEVRILKIDSEGQRISLSMKKAEEPRASAKDNDGKPGKSKKKRKKPLRGGLASHFQWW
ncbi:MAG: S1 RNA-binding domain-containing protein [Planctomycetota bacterium]|jgi:small subunit ribosomal protein S1